MTARWESFGQGVAAVRRRRHWCASGAGRRQ